MAPRTRRMLFKVDDFQCTYAFGMDKKQGELIDVCVFFLESCWITIWIGHLFVLVGVEC